MREIKFRAWDKVENKMINDFILNSKGNMYVVEYGELVATYREDYYNLMQYTGLKDSNGKEIYEGDIIEVERECAFVYTPYKTVAVVKFGFHEVGYDSDMATTGPAYGFYLEHLKENIHEYDTPKNISLIGEYVTMLDTDKMEVIGNIYENPELLE